MLQRSRQYTPLGVRMRTGLGDAPEGSLLLCGDAGAPYGALRRVRAVVVHSRASLLLWSGL
jgi:hypothetical protein